MCLELWISHHVPSKKVLLHKERVTNFAAPIVPMHVEVHMMTVVAAKSIRRATIYSHPVGYHCTLHGKTVVKLLAVQLLRPLNNGVMNARATQKKMMMMRNV